MKKRLLFLSALLVTMVASVQSQTTFASGSYLWDKDGYTYTSSQTVTKVMDGVTYKLILTITDPGIPIDATNFPDENFRNYIKTGTFYNSNTGYLEKVNKNEDDYLTNDELSTVALEFGRYYYAPEAISSVKGIELFPELKKVTCYGNNLAGASVDELISLLPTRTGNDGLLYFEEAGYERANRITAQQIAAAKAKGWKVMGEFHGNWIESVGLILPLYFEFKVGEYEWDHVYLSEENISSFKELLEAKGIAAEGSLTYNKSTHTLTIDNLKVNAELHNDHQIYDRYYYEKDPMVGTLVIKGSNELMGFRTWYEQEYNIKGDGTLKINVGSVNWSANKVTYDGPTLEVNASLYNDANAIWMNANENVNLTIKSGTMRLTATGIPLEVSVYHGNASLTLGNGVKVVEPIGAKQGILGEGNDYAVIFTDAQGNNLVNTTLVIETEAQPESYSIYIIYTAGVATHGEIFVSNYGPATNNVVTITCKPESGYQLKSLVAKCLGEEIPLTMITNTEPWETTGYTFVMPAGNVEIYPLFGVISGQPTGISEERTANIKKSEGFTLGGVKANGTQRGVIIQRGKKIVVK